MEKDKPYLTLVDPDRDRSRDEEFSPLPYYGWDERPSTLPLDPDECATAIHLAQGDLPAAAALLKVPHHKLHRQVVIHPRLARVLSESLALAHNRAASEYIRALDSPSDRRREWAAAKILSTRSAASHPFAPAPPQPSTASLSLQQSGPSRTLTFRWRTDEDDVKTIDGSG
jgi:hypothetical protein